MKQSTSGRWPIALGGIALLSWTLYLILALSSGAPDWLPDVFRLPDDDAGAQILTSRGQFGDAFGAFNALVSTFALIGLLFTIRTQQDQIRSQETTSERNDLLLRQQQFQEQFYRAVDTYRDLLCDTTAIVAGGAESTGNEVFGRVALQAIWRQQFIAAINTSDLPLFQAAIRAQRDAYRNELLGIWNTNLNAASSLSALLDAVAVDATLLETCLDRIGAAWSSTYLANRFQLDSLFRSWYTAYRVLATADLYAIPESAKHLYSSAFRSRISWIEMAFLLVNQFGLPGNAKFPKACKYSNLHAAFDNLDVANDVVVCLLATVARQRVAPIDPNAEIGAAAFGPTDFLLQ